MGLASEPVIRNGYEPFEIGAARVALPSFINSGADEPRKQVAVCSTAARGMSFQG